MSKGIGQYDLEYSQCNCFWGTNPGKFVKLIPEIVTKGKVLDLGAGEGKNSIYLAERNYNVTAVEISKFALKNFKEQLDTLNDSIKSQIKIVEQDALEFESVNNFDIVIAYGLLHCLKSSVDIDILIKKMKRLTEIGGIIVIVSFNNRISVPDVQDYLEPTLLPVDYLLKAFSGWEIVHYEDDIITESHPTSKVEHQHSLTRILVKKLIHD